ncbi:hypothetical protein BISU_0936 [Bifidobacterium subtile]|jgi:hypothetical protein|uniref:Uncharacterized protein n=1 Tax=Bifidobacterium subtile TaxID=77635 RepID=A0A087E5F8_9BIFI|nr:hypothetical protein BISU_0936 [Bifidobacterium subtile]
MGFPTMSTFISIACIGIRHSNIHQSTVTSDKMLGQDARAASSNSLA